MALVLINPLLGMQAPLPFWDPVIDAGYEGPDYADDRPWKLATLNGIKVPGETDVKCVPKVKIDIPKATNRDGGTAIYRGHQPAKVDLTIRIWTPSQWILFQQLLREIWRWPGAPVPAGSMKAITIAHPSCALWGISSMLIENPESPEITLEGARFRIQGLQYIPSKNQAVAKKASGSGPAVAPEIAAARKKNDIPPKPSTQVVARAPGPPNQGSI
jgi:hypothetical protein